MFFRDDGVPASAPTKEDPSTGETSPLLPKAPQKKKSQRRWPRSVLYRVLITSFIMSLSFGVTQVSITIHNEKSKIG